MSQPNPFASPQHTGDQAPPGSGGLTTSPRMLDIMRQTRVWVLLLSILGFIGVGLQLVILMLQRAGVAELIVFVVMSAINFALLVTLFLYGQRIGHFLRAGDAPSLAEALRMQRIYWTIAGVTLAILLVLLVLGLVLMLGLLVLRAR